MAFFTSGQFSCLRATTRTPGKLFVGKRRFPGLPEPIHSLRKAAPCAQGGKHRPDVLLVHERKTLPQLPAPVLNGSLQIALGQTGKGEDRQFTSDSRVQIGNGLVQKFRRRFGNAVDLTDGTGMLRRQTFQNPFRLCHEVGLNQKPEAIAQVLLRELSGFQHHVDQRHTAFRQRLRRSPEGRRPRRAPRRPVGASAPEAHSRPHRDRL